MPPYLGKVCPQGLAAHPSLVPPYVAVATLTFLPAYSPDPNPIEQAFAKLKELLRAEAPRTVEALWPAVGRLLNRLTSAECANYIAHAGYRYSG